MEVPPPLPADRLPAPWPGSVYGNHGVQASCQRCSCSVWWLLAPTDPPSNGHWCGAEEGTGTGLLSSMASVCLAQGAQSWTQVRGNVTSLHLLPELCLLQPRVASPPLPRGCFDTFELGLILGSSMTQLFAQLLQSWLYPSIYRCKGLSLPGARD